MCAYTYGSGAFKSTDYKYRTGAFLTRYKLIDLFCGCGGISRGFQKTGHFDVEYGVELEHHPAQTFTRNIRNSLGRPTPVFERDIEELVASDRVFWDHLKPTGIEQAAQIDVLVGGPPCQGFSRNGVRQYIASGIRFYDDPRNHLYKAFLLAVEMLRPTVLLIENVREFLNFGEGKFSDDLLTRLDELGYVTDFRKICAADYGVPQMRHRVFFLGISKDIYRASKNPLPFPQPTFSSTGVQLGLLQDFQYRTVRDAISDLPAPVYEHGQATPYSHSSKPSEYAAYMRSPTGKVYNHVARTLSETSKARIRAVGTGRMKHIEKPLRTNSFYGSAYRRLEWDEPALTITTWVYHVGSGRFAHPSEDRGITMREAARLQSFDDDFIFPDLINPVSQMIGNAVPPLLATRFAESIAAYLDRARQHSSAIPQSNRLSTAA